MAYDRNGVLPTKTVTLTSIFMDDLGNLVDPDAVPEVYFYSFATDSELVDSDIESQTYVNAEDGPVTAVKITDGIYTVDYTVPVVFRLSQLLALMLLS